MKFDKVGTYVYVSKSIDHPYCRKHNLSVGDRGRVLAESTHSSDQTKYLIEFDKYIGGHNGDRRGKDGHCWWIFEEYLSFHKECSPVYIDGLI